MCVGYTYIRDHELSREKREQSSEKKKQINVDVGSPTSPELHSNETPRSSQLRTDRSVSLLCVYCELLPFNSCGWMDGYSSSRPVSGVPSPGRPGTGARVW